jgi:uncharacterized protein (UPF0332 family)
VKKVRFQEEIQANIERAGQAIEAAETLMGGGFIDFAASRAYYAAFYAATALLLGEEKTFSKHSGVIAAIHKYFVKTGKLEKQFGKDLNWLFELRGLGDYGVTSHVPEEEAGQAIQVARDFVRQVKLIQAPEDE